jgi:hypothetical protein
MMFDRELIGVHVAGSASGGGFWRNFRKAIGHPLRSQIVEAYVLLFVVDLAVRCFGLLSVWRSLSNQWRSARRSIAPSAREITGLARAVRCAARFQPYAMNCLPQSLALAWLLARRGVAVDLRLGVARQRGKFEAHAWLERDGVTISDTAQMTQQFVPLHGRQSAFSFHTRAFE